MDDALLDVLRAANPWLTAPATFPAAASHRIPDPFVPRDVPVLATWPVPQRAHLVVGARQVGKSSLLWSWCRDTGRAPLFVNAEEPLVTLWARSPTLVARDIAGLVAPESPVLVDEAQHLPEAGLLVKGLVDSGLPNPLFVTGSSSFHLEARTRESLAGRAIRLALHPFSLREITRPFDQLPPLLRAARVRETAFRHMVVGGYPRAWLGDDPALVLTLLVESFVVRDASDRFRIEHLDAFRTLLGLVARQAGDLVNVAEWASVCGVARGTIDQYLAILEDTHILRVVRPFVGGRRAELTHRPKVYVADTGLRNAIVRQFDPVERRPDRSALFESWVAGELAKRLSPLSPQDVLRFWRSRSGAEVDFVVERPAGLHAFEAKAAALRRPELSRSARSFIEAYAPRRFCVLNFSLTATERIGPTEVCWLPPEAFADPAGPLSD